MKRRSRAVWSLIGILLLIFFAAAGIIRITDSGGRSEYDVSRMRQLFEQGEYRRIISYKDRLPEEQQLSLENLYLTALSQYALASQEHDSRLYMQAAENLELAKIVYPEETSRMGYLHEILGLSYRYLGNWEKAYSVLEQTAGIGNASERIYLHLGFLSRKLGRLEKMEHYLTAYGSPDRSMVQFMLDAYIEAGDIEAALRVVRNAAGEADTPEEELVFSRQEVELLAEQGREAEAVSRLSILLDNRFENMKAAAELYLLLGDLHASRGDLLEARAAWREAAGHDSTKIEARKRLDSYR